MNPVDAYSRAVVDGQVPAGKYHRLCCARHVRDRAREGTPDFPYRFELALAERFFRFVSKLKHYQGRQWAGKFIELQPQQLFRLGSLFGWIHVETGLRRFRTSYNELPRKNGKSLEASLVAIYVVFFDNEPGARGYCIATKREQAKIVFEGSVELVRSSALTSRITTQVGNLSCGTCRLEPLGADADSTDGLHPHLISVDELHRHKNRKLLDVMETATGQRLQPVNFQITTAGEDPVSPCGDQHDYATKILDQLIEDETFSAFIAHADPDDDWLSEATWEKANPNWAIINQDDMRNLARKAMHMPSAAASFKRLRLNLWVSSGASACLSVDGWRQGQTLWHPDDLLHEPCFAGVDLASLIDLCCLSLVFPPTPARPSWRLIQHILTAEDTLKERAHRDRAPYDVWRDQGWIETTPGTRIDHQRLRPLLREARERYDVHQIGFDPYHADTLINQLVNEDGFAEEQVLVVDQKIKANGGMGQACREMQAEILGGHVDARGCPVTAWAVSNVAGYEDGPLNLMFSKKKSRGRIDPVIAATIGMALALRMPAEPKSVYLERGVRTLGA